MRSKKMTRIGSKKGFIATGEYHISPNLQRIRRLIRKRNPITDIKKLQLHEEQTND